MTHDASTLARAAVTSAVAEIRALSGTGPYASVLRLLDALKTSYMLDLLDVRPEDLLLKQGAARQVLLLQSALTAPIATLPIV